LHALKQSFVDFAVIKNLTFADEILTISVRLRFRRFHYFRFGSYCYFRLLGVGKITVLNSSWILPCS